MRIRRLVVVDASPIIGLAKAGALDLLRGLFGEISVTDAVQAEVLAGNGLPGAAELEAAVEDGWVRLVPNQTNPAFAHLGEGEATTLTHAIAIDAGVVMDDRAGRRQAGAHQLDVIGTVGVLLAAKRLSLVDELRPLFDKLRQRGFHIAEDAVRAALDQVGET